MSKTATINMRIEPEVKAQVEELYAHFGMSVTDAITMFLHISLIVGGLPFDVRIVRNAQNANGDDTDSYSENATAIQRMPGILADLNTTIMSTLGMWMTLLTGMNFLGM